MAVTKYSMVAPKDFYDNFTEEMPEFWDKVAGRARRGGDASGLDAEDHTEEFTAQWIFQRFVNRVMQLFTRKECPWYYVAVEGPNLVTKGCQGWGYLVIVVFTLLAPLLFVFVFGLAVLILPIFFFRCQEMSLRADEIVKAWGCSALYLWFSLFPCYFVWHKHTYGAEGDVYHSDFSSLLATVACCAAGFRMTRTIFVSACMCACQKELSRIEDEEQYGEAVSNIKEALSDPDDGWTVDLFSQDKNESGDCRGSDGWPAWRVYIFVIIAAAPQAWHMWSDRVQAPSKLMSAMLITTIIALPIGMCIYLKDFQRVLHKYERVVKALTIFIYVGACDADKHQDPLKSDYKNIMKEFQNGDERIHQLENIVQPHTYRKNELDSMEVCRVTINFSTPEGVFLYRRLHAWMITFMHGSASEIQMFLNLSLFFIIAGFIRLAYIMWENKLDLDAAVSADASVKTLPLPLAALCIYMLRSLNCCANANNYLFDDYKRILCGWKSNLLDPLSDFQQAHILPAVGWCKSNRGDVTALPYDWKKYSGDVLQKSSSQALNVTMEHLSVNGCKKQRMLGMQITHEFRRRALFSLGTLTLTVVMRVASTVLKKCLATDFGHSDTPIFQI